jgi:putative membrane protein
MASMTLIGILVGMVVIFFILVGLVILAVWAMRRSGGLGGSARPQTAREVLELRYARGEITREEYQQMKQDLNG